MPEVKILPLVKTLFDLDTMSDVTCTKDVPFEPVTTTAEALARLNGDAAKFIQVINDGLETEARAAARNDSSIPWMVEDEDGDKTEFSGTPADSKAVNGLVLTLAKTIFGYKKESSSEEKRTAKQSAFEMVKSNEAIRNGLKENAAA